MPRAATCAGIDMWEALVKPGDGGRSASRVPRGQGGLAPTGDRLPPHPGITRPDAPDLLFVGGLGIVGQQRRHQRAGGPAELDPFLRRPALEDGVQHAADKAVAAADTVQHADVPRLDHVEVVAFGHDRAPPVMIRADHFTQRRGKDLGPGKACFAARSCP